jgi:hypothetical protein
VPAAAGKHTEQKEIRPEKGIILLNRANKMIVYNVTVSLADESIHEEWMHWMKEVHIPEVMQTRLFEDYRILRLLQEENNGITYAIQYRSKSLEEYYRYQQEFAPCTASQNQRKVRGKVTGFSHPAGRSVIHAAKTREKQPPKSNVTASVARQTPQCEHHHSNRSLLLHYPLKNKIFIYCSLKNQTDET